MRKLRILLFLCVFFHQSVAQPRPQYLFPAFHPDSIRTIVEVLAADSLEGRLTGSEGCNKAAAFIASAFQKAGLLPLAGLDGYYMPIGKSAVNVVGGLPGKSKPDELIIFSAHYDHIGTVSTNPFPKIPDRSPARKGDSVYNGANDNASGVSAIISLAKYFADQNMNERTLLFVAFAGEEFGLLGSKHFASLCEPDSIKAVINFEMIGRKNNKQGNPYLTGNRHSNLIDILNSRLHEFDANLYGKKYIRPDKYVHENLFFRSDNYPFALMGVPAHSIMAADPSDLHYHSLTDEVSTLDYKLISRIIQAVAISSRGLADGRDTPSRLK